MEFRHALLHRERRTAVVGVWRLAGLEADALLTNCPCCGSEFFADVIRSQSIHTITRDITAVLDRLPNERAAARVILQLECPDHPHRFHAG
jgi:hypothetical protein